MNIRHVLTWLASFVLAALAGPVTGHAQPSVLPQPLDFRSDPVLMVASYYNAISLGDYERAYNYWEGAPSSATLEQFAAGFADTERVAAYLAIPVFEDFDGGNMFARVSVLLAVEHTDASLHTYAGCMTVRNVSAPVGSTSEPASDWRLHTGAITEHAQFDLSLLSTACPPPFDGSEFIYSNRNSPTEVLGAYADALQTRDYVRAYRYWASPPEPTLAEFVAGFSETASASIAIRADVLIEAGAGGVYAHLPALVTASDTGGGISYYGGCYIARRSNVPVGEAGAPSPAWWLIDADLTWLDPATLRDGLTLLDGTCVTIQADA